MIQVTVGTNVNRSRVVVSPDTTIRQVLENNDVNYETTNVHLDGASLQVGDIDKTFSDFNIQESCYLIAVAKADNA